ncbi:S8 family serine peptidase [Kribbella catacumbae]|uniref:S8 family serine peptidase n=1 Tax=Kribbella catacumbae TaxID=460086 RepID=UPI0003805AD1|nr:S8 family serine peptidase [Kribbella catacumbae]
MTGSSGSAAEPGPYRPPFTAHHNSAKAEFEPNAVIVKFKKKATASAREAAVSKFRATTEDSVSSDIVKLEGDLPAPELLKKVKADPTVELAALNYKRRIAAVPNDEYYGTDQALSLNTVRVPQAWDLSKSTGSQIVAVLDTGVDAGHPDLAGHLVPGYNAVSSTRPNPVDDNGHGTMTLGIIAAGANNGIGVAGVGWNVKAMPVKVLDAKGEGYDADIAEGVDWAVAHGTKVINMSLSGPGDNAVLRDAIQRAVAAGVVVVAAAGNEGNDVVQYPAAYPEVIAVGATNAYGVMTYFSSHGDWVDIAAPGWDILSTGVRSMTPSGYEPYWYCTGTSCSAPIVAAVAALVKNKWPAFTPAQVQTRLKLLSRDAGPRGIDPYYGAGVLDAYADLGGKRTGDFRINPVGGTDQPGDAAEIVSVPATSSSVVGIEGDVNWSELKSSVARNLKVTLTGPEFDCANSANFAPRLDVYDGELRSLAHAVNAFPATGCGQPVKLSVTVNVSAPAGSTFFAVRNDNGSWDNSKAYTLSITEEGAGSAPTGTAYPVRDVLPRDMSETTRTMDPSVTFARDVVANTVTASTVRLLSGKTGTTVAATVAYDAATRRAVITATPPPAAAYPDDPEALTDNTPYRIRVTGVQEADGTPLAPFTSTFFTADTVPPQVAPFDATGAYLAANLSWTIHPMTDLDKVIVRRNAGNTVPTPTTGTLVYSGTGTAVKDTGLAQGVTYTYAAFALDHPGQYSLPNLKRLLGMKTGISTTSTLINYGGSITLRGSLLGIDNKAYYGVPINMYVRPKNSSTFKLLATVKTTKTGTVSYTYKPTVSSVIMMTFPGNDDMMGTRTPDITVQVAPTISATLSPATIRLGQATKFSGYLAPAHYGKPVYLQQYANKTWKSIASVKQSASGAYAFGIKPAIRGQIAYRVWFPGDADHAQAFATNKILTIS